MAFQDVYKRQDFMLVAMPLVFVGPGVALMESFGLMKDSLLGILIISVLSTMVVMVLTGPVSYTHLDRDHRTDHESECEYGKEQAVPGNG